MWKAYYATMTIFFERLTKDSTVFCQYRAFRLTRIEAIIWKILPFWFPLSLVLMFCRGTHFHTARVSTKSSIEYQAQITATFTKPKQDHTQPLEICYLFTFICFIIYFQYFVRNLKKKTNEKRKCNPKVLIHTTCWLHLT